MSPKNAGAESTRSGRLRISADLLAPVSWIASTALRPLFCGVAVDLLGCALSSGLGHASNPGAHPFGAFDLAPAQDGADLAAVSVSFIVSHVLMQPSPHRR